MALRDDFSGSTKETLAKRVSQRCSNASCRQPTSGPQEDPAKAVNIGVAAHISAAAGGGPRYDPTMTSEQRCAIENGIWLCQNCAKLIDNDPGFYTPDVLRAWRVLAEAAARRELEQRRDPERDRPFRRLERDMPALLAEMRSDLRDYPLSRVLIPMKKGWCYWGEGHELSYFYEEHPNLDSQVLILESVGAIRDVTRGSNVKKYLMTEEFVDFLGVAEQSRSTAG